MTAAPSNERRHAAVWTSADLASGPHADAAKADKVRRMFAAIARRYDLNNTLHSFGRDAAWRRAAVRLAALRPGDEVLDVACGTGALTRAFASARPSPARVIGADFTPEMLDVARGRLGEARPGAAPIEYQLADAMALPFADDSFDVLSIAFGIRNVADPSTALREFRRVLRPGGRLVVLEFDRPRIAAIAWLNDLYTARVMPVTASVIAGDRSGAYRYLPKSVATFASRAEMARMLAASGFASVTQTPLTFGVCVIHRAVSP